MLKVTFNLRDGTFTDIPDDAHYFLIEDYDKLTPSQQTLLKRYIIKSFIHIQFNLFIYFFGETIKNLIKCTALIHLMRILSFF